MAKAPTLKDVAAIAGVHVSVVSKVLTGSATLNIRPETRERIEAAATELQYRPNVTAQALRSSSTGTIGMLVPSLRNPVYAQIIRGAFERAWARDFVVVIAEDLTGGNAEAAYQRLGQAGRIDGLLVAGAHPGTRFPAEGRTDLLPIVFVNRRHPGGTNVCMREEDAAVLAVEHLLGLGHVHVAHLAGPAIIDTAKRRVDGYRKAIGRSRPLIVHAPFDERSGYKAMCELMSRRHPPTAVFVSNINQAIGALAAARDTNVSVPEDVSVIAYDDDLIADYLSPALTAVRMPLYEMGGTAVDVLLDGVRGGPCDITVSTAPELVVRASTASPP